MHACCSILMGFFFFSIKDPGWPSANYLVAFIIPFLIHGFYDYFIFTQDIPYWIAYIFIAIIAFFCYQLTEVVLTFHHSDYEKIKFSGEEGFLKPGGGKIYTIDSFADRVIDVLVSIGGLIFFTLIFFHTPIGDGVIGLLDEIRVGAIKILGG